MLETGPGVLLKIQIWSDGLDGGSKAGLWCPNRSDGDSIRMMISETKETEATP